MRCLDNEDSDNWPRSLLNVRVEKLLDFWLEPKAFKLKKSFAIRSVLRMSNRTNNRPLREAMEEQYIGWIIGLERVTSVFRLIQTMLVLLEWLLPLLEDVRLSANQRDYLPPGKLSELSLVQTPHLCLQDLLPTSACRDILNAHLQASCRSFHLSKHLTCVSRTHSQPQPVEIFSSMSQKHVVSGNQLTSHFHQMTYRPTCPKSETKHII